MRRSKPLALSRQSIRLRNQKFKIPRPERSWEAGTQEDLASRMLTTQQCCTADQRTRSVICSCQRPTRNSVRSPHHEQHHRKPRASRSPIKSSGAGYYTAAGRTREMHGVGGGWAHGLSWGPCNRLRPEPGPSLRYICGAARAVRRRQHLWIQRHCWDPSIPPRQGEHVCEPNHQQICPERLLGSSHDGP